MTTVNKVKEIQKLANLLAQLDEASSAEYKMLKDVTDDFSDLDDEIFNPEITFIVDKLHDKIVKISGSSDSEPKAEKKEGKIEPKEEKQARSKKDEVLDEIFANDPDGMLDDKAKAEFKVGDSVSIKSKPFTGKGIVISVELQEGGVDFKYRVDSYGTQVTIYSQDKIMKLFKEKAESKVDPTAKPEPKPKPEPKAKKVEPEYNGGFVAKESIEHKIVSRFLGLRAKDAPESLVLNAYTQLQKMIANQEVRKTNPHADLIKAIQGSYYNMLTKADIKKLVLSESLNAKAIYLFDNERRYSSVKFMSEFAGWTGKSKTLKQIELFVKKAENVLKEGKGTDPYHDELKAVVKSLSSAKEGQSIVPESIGLSGLGSVFAIKVVR